MEVIYNNKSIKNGEFLKVAETKKQPKIKLDMNPEKFYTLIVHDPNAVGGNKIHWAIINILNNDIKNGIVIIPYKGPAPPANTGVHHYKFELYEQPRYHNINPIDERFFTMDEIRDRLKLNNRKPKIRMQFKIQSDDQIINWEVIIPITFAGALVAGLMLNRS
jgi:phosphatidylethanolamine-binding protein (PEBP) family uncharacterized protein